MPEDDLLNRPGGNGQDPSAKQQNETQGDRQEVLTTWWARHWLRTLAQWLNAERLAQGKEYVEQGHPSKLKVSVGSVVAQIEGPALQPHQIHIEINTFDDKEWERALDAMFQQAGYAAQLLNGEMPPDIEVVFRSVGLSLFPGDRSELRSHCSCGSPIIPCEHVGAVYHLLAQRLEEDPFLLFRMRGRTREQVLAAFRTRRASHSQRERVRQGYGQGEGADSANAPVPLPTDSHTFWKMGPEIEHVEVDVEPAKVHMEVLKLLGIPSFVDKETLRENLPRVYQRVSQKALEIAYGEHRSSESDSETSSGGHSE